jgi:hypothetical protein
MSAAPEARPAKLERIAPALRKRRGLVAILLTIVLLTAAAIYAFTPRMFDSRAVIRLGTPETERHPSIWSPG